MKINGQTKLHALLEEYPYLLDFLVTLSPQYAKLKNPLLRKTVGRLATLQQVAEEGKISLEELLSSLEGEIRKRTMRAGEEASSLAQGKFSDTARSEALKQIIRELHRGGKVEELKERFAALIKDVGPEEIARLEQQVIEEGIPEEEVKKLCDLHVKIFEESLESQKAPEVLPGHPVHTLMAENRAAEKLLAEIRLILERLPRENNELERESNFKELVNLLADLGQIDLHYLKKENQLFPRLENKGVVGPTKVMWAIHDDIRKGLKELRKMVEGQGYSEIRVQEIVSRSEQLIQMIQDMIYKEEKILFPMSLEVLSEVDWAKVKLGEEEVGYAWIKPGQVWQPHLQPSPQSSAPKAAYSGSEMRGGIEGAQEQRPESAGQPDEQAGRDADVFAAGRENTGIAGSGMVGVLLNLRTGQLSPEQVDLMLRHLPVDISFVDENDTVIYYSDTPGRIFPRSPGVIGRKVQNCHPPKSVHIVNRILEAFKKGEQDVAEFWIELQGRFIHIRYFAVRDERRRYRGCLEVSQEVTAIRALQGQKRLLDWE